jgi:hypothetical protein
MKVWWPFCSPYTCLGGEDVSLNANHVEDKPNIWGKQKRHPIVVRICRVGQSAYVTFTLYRHLTKFVTKNTGSAIFANYAETLAKSNNADDIFQEDGVLVVRFITGLILLGLVVSDASAAFVSKKRQATGRGKSSHVKIAKKPDAKTAQKKAEAEQFRHEREMRYRQFQQSQQAQQQGMQQQMQQQQKP